MDFLELARRRYSVRAYKPDPVEEDKLQKVLEAARLAPSASNRQPFRLIVSSSLAPPTGRPTCGASTTVGGLCRRRLSSASVPSQNRRGGGWTANRTPTSMLPSLDRRFRSGGCPRGAGAAGEHGAHCLHPLGLCRRPTPVQGAQAAVRAGQVREVGKPRWIAAWPSRFLMAWQVGPRLLPGA